MNPSVLALADSLVGRLRARHWTLATGESCTGGLLSAYLTANPGISDVFTHGFTAYSNLAKLDVLGVERMVAEEFGSVSEPVAVQMAEGAAAAGRTDIGLGLTGIAGPGGGTEEKPVGLVFGAICIRGTSQSQQWFFSGSRTDIRESSVKALLTFANTALRDLELLRRH